MKQRTIFTMAVLAGLCLAGCGEVAEQVAKATGTACPMTIEEDIYVPVELLEGEVQAMDYEWGSNPNTTTNVSMIDDDVWELEVIEGVCNTHTFYFFGTM